MIYRIFKAELKYLYYEFTSLSRSNLILGLLFIIFYFYCIFSRRGEPDYDSSQSFVVIELISIYILLRMILSGFSLPNNIFEFEENRGNILIYNGISDSNIVINYYIRICLKSIFSYFLNVFSLGLIMSALDLITDIRNFIAIAVLMLIGSIHTLTLGFIICAIIQILKLKRELILVFQIIYLVIYFNADDSYLFPITILMTQLSGILSDDILYSTFNIQETLSYIPMGIVIITCFIFTLFLTYYLITTLSLKNNYRCENEK